LGLKGEVIYTNEEGDSIVSVNEYMWRCNPAVLILEHDDENDNHSEATEQGEYLFYYYLSNEIII
jgi:hypothetical protein